MGGMVSWFALWQLAEPMADLSTKLGLSNFSPWLSSPWPCLQESEIPPCRGLLAGSREYRSHARHAPGIRRVTLDFRADIYERGLSINPCAYRYVCHR